MMTISKRAKKRLVALMALIVLAIPSEVYAIDVDPGDYTPLAPGTFLAIGYGQWATRSQINVVGTGNIYSGYKLDSAIGIARFVSYVDIAGITVDPQILIPFGSEYNAELGGLRAPSSSGLGDPILAATFWLVNKPDPVYPTYFGITPFLSIPLGTYDSSRAVNLGAHQWTGTIQAGLIKGVAPNVLIDLIADAKFYGDNTNANPTGSVLRDNPSYELQAWFRYNVSDKLTLAAGYAYNFGGAQYLDGVPNGLRTEFQQVRGSIQYFIAPDWQLQVQAIHDFDVSGGFPEDVGVRVRALKIFSPETPAHAPIIAKY